MAIININPTSLYDGAPNGLSQARVDTDSGLVHVSGQVDWSTDFEASGTDIATQSERSIQNLRIVLEEAGSSLAHVLQLRVYLRGEVADHLETVVPVLVRHFGEIRPAVTAIGVASLAARDLLVEIEAVAKVAN